MSSELPLHDAQKTVADLRDHLARHDKPIAFFFGAGTSSAVQVPMPGEPENTRPLIPAVTGLTKLCQEDADSLGQKCKDAWIAIVKQCEENGQDPNLETILSRIRMMLSAIGNADTLSGLNKDELTMLEESVRKTIAKVVTPDLSTITDELPHRKFSRWLSKTSRQNPVEIFTVNYDVLFEDSLEAERIPTFDGFVGCYRPFFHPDALRRLDTAPGANWTRLWKMHGSVTWRRIEQAGRYRVIRGEPNLEGEMIFPSFQKYDESRLQPYSAFTDRLSRFLEQDDALLIVAGFSFGDEHINNLIFETLENRPRTHVYALQFSEIPENRDLVSRAKQRSNMIVIGPETGIVGGRRARWAPIETPSFMGDIFELKEAEAVGAEGVGEETIEADKSGYMKIGDFSVFCDFLEAMTTG